MEQRAVIKFNAKLGKSASETFRSMQQVYGSQCLSRTDVFEWHKRFLEDRETLEDDKKSGRPILVRTPEMIEKVRDFVANDRNASLKMMEEALNISRETIRTILHEDLGKTKICTNWDVLTHPPYSPDLAPSDYHLFTKLKESLAGKRFQSDEEVQTAVTNWTKELAGSFYAEGISKLVSRYTKCIEIDGNYVEKD
ncbi:FLJ37770-like protein [Acromyrmex echinatior]|uniref:FLJ37770-like protein n=1 Tax=Acromyrmex echinatior TaxID=103372 RepID=F4W584_ACREC|nr:FLJ37770-like protein [Acromyrmex echinatior]